MRSGGPPTSRYRLDERLDSDGLCEVWRATFVATGVTRILRVLKAEHRERADEWTGLLRHQQRISHPARTEIIDVTTIDGRPAAVLEVSSGPSMSTWARARLRRVEDVLSAFRPLVNGVRAAHQAGVVHGSIDGRRIVMTHLRGPLVPRLDLAYGALAVHVGPLAPEWATGASPDERSDLYQLGTLLYELLARVPFEGTAAALETARPDTPAAVGDLVRALVDPNPARRPPTAGALHDTLVAAQQ